MQLSHAVPEKIAQYRTNDELVIHASHRLVSILQQRGEEPPDGDAKDEPVRRAPPGDLGSIQDGIIPHLLAQSMNIRRPSESLEKRHEHFADESRARAVASLDNGLAAFRGSRRKPVKSLSAGLFKKKGQVPQEGIVAEVAEQDRDGPVREVPGEGMVCLENIGNRRRGLELLEDDTASAAGEVRYL